MGPNRRRAIGVLLFVALCAVFMLERVFNPPVAQLYTALVEEKSATADEVKYLKNVVGEIAKRAGEHRSVGVNEKYADTKLNVALVDFSRVDRARYRLPQEGLHAFPPNVLVIDVNTFRSIVLHTYNEALSFAQAIGEMQETKDEEASAEAAATMGALSLQLRLANFARYDEIDPTSVPRIVSVISDPQVTKAFVLPFVFFIAHELHHLRTVSGPGFDARVEEIAADSKARDVAAKFLDLELDDDRPGVMIEKQLLFSGFRYMQDRILEYAFRDFRGLSASSLFVTLLHKDCRVANEIPWPRRFNNPDVVMLGMVRPMPMLADDEIATIRGRLERFKDVSHEHLLSRVVHAIEIFDRDPTLKESTGVFDPARELLKIYDERSSELSPVEEADAGGLGKVPASDVLTRLHVRVKTSSVPGCERGKCVVGNVGDGYLEMVVRDGRVSFLELAQPASIEGVAASLAALDVLVGEDTAKKVMMEVARKRGECRVATVSDRSGPYTLLAHTMNEDGWVEITAVAKDE